MNPAQELVVKLVIYFLVFIGIPAAMSYEYVQKNRHKNRHHPMRFSLRTLFIATTLVAVVLGLIVWLR